MNASWLLVLLALAPRPAAAVIDPMSPATAAGQDAEDVYKQMQDGFLTGKPRTVSSAGLKASARSANEPSFCPPVAALARNYNRLVQGRTLTPTKLVELSACLNVSTSWVDEVARSSRSPDLSKAEKVVADLQSPFDSSGGAGDGSGNGVGAGPGVGGGLGGGAKGGRTRPRGGRGSGGGLSPSLDPPTDYKKDKPGSSLFPDPEKVSDILDLQIFKKVQRASLPSGESIELINLNANVGVWYLYSARTASGQGIIYNLEVSGAKPAKLTLVGADIQIDTGDPLTSKKCSLVRRDHGEFQPAETVNPDLAYAPLCGGALYSRSDRTTVDIEGSLSQSLTANTWTRWLYTKFKAVSGIADGEEEGELLASAGTDGKAAAPSLGPAAAETGLPRVVPTGSTSLEVQLKGAPLVLQYGRWYETKDFSGVYVSLMTADAASSRVKDSYRNRVDKTDGGGSIVYLAAFDLDRYALGFKTAEDDRNLDWSYWGEKDGSSHPGKGPDGVGDPGLLTTNGVVRPDIRDRLVSVFKAGYRLGDMVMVQGPLAGVHRNSHWGIVEDGVVFRRPSPGLATAVTYVDGKTDVIRWPEDDAALLPKVRFLRQNETPIVDGHDETGLSVPDESVGGESFSHSNWRSGTADDLRRRAGLAIQVSNGRRYLVYSFFSGAAPSTMARVYQAYGFDGGMQLDINIPETARLPFFSDARKLKGEALYSDDDDLSEYVSRVGNYDFFYILKK